MSKTRAPESYAKLPLYFVENAGQLDKEVAYYIQGRDKSIYFTSSGVTFALISRIKSESTAKRWIVKLDFVGARSGVRPEGEGQTGAVFSYFKGSSDAWKAGLRSFEKIVYRDLWPGIDLIYSGTVNRMKYTFIVHPGADASLIKLAYHGTTNVKINSEGELAIETPLGGFEDDEPVSMQNVDGGEFEVRTSYRIEGRSDNEGTTYGFELGPYDHSRELVIDPAVLVYCGYIGGGASSFEGGNDSGQAIAIDTSGNSYLTGFTNSVAAAFPVTVGPDLTFNGNTDAFIVKINAAGTALVYCGYIGGAGEDFGQGVAVDSAGNAYITGFTDSNSATFPVSVGPDLIYNGGTDAFVAKVNAGGTALAYCGYIGGDQLDQGNGIAVDGAGNAYIAGYTNSSEATFPETVGPDIAYNNNQDAFVTKVNSSGTALVYCGYIGGGEFDQGNGIAVDSFGNAYVTGFTNSAEATFPETVGPDLLYNSGGDAFVAKVNSGGTALDYCGYIGGSSQDIGNGIAVDVSGNAYVTGLTNSTESTFPQVVGPDLLPNGGQDAFVAKVNSGGTALAYCGYLGGSDEESGQGIAVDSSGNAYVTGVTSSTEATFPDGDGFGVLTGPDGTHNGGGNDAFVAKVNVGGTALTYCGYIGGNGFDQGNGIAVDSSGKAYITGPTSSTESSFPETVGPDLVFNGGGIDIFVAKVNSAGSALDYCGYIGGRPASAEVGNAIAVDGSGNAYVTGFTDSTESGFPLNAGPDLTYNGSFDAFVAKVNTAGTALVYCGYIGGSEDDFGQGIALDSAGNAYITGFTYSSTAASFPAIVGPDLIYNGASDAFVAKVNAAGTALLYCGYIGGSSDDVGRAIAVDSGGNAYVSGETSSTQVTFPDGDGFGSVTGPDVTHNGGGVDAFVAKVNSAGTALPYSGYIGGSGADISQGIAVDSAGNAYVTGLTSSTHTTFPDGDGFGSVTGPDVTHNGGSDAFIAKINSAGTALVYCGYIGGSSSDSGFGIALDSSSNAYVTGIALSTQATFPDGDGFGSVTGPDVTHNGNFDVFIAKVNAAGTALVYCGYIGGSLDDVGQGIAVDSLGNAFVTGYTSSTEATFPDGDGFGTVTGPDITQNGENDAFIARLNPAGTALDYCGYIGGSASDQGNGIAVDSAGNAYVVGSTFSTEESFPVTGGPDLTFNNSQDAFVAKIVAVLVTNGTFEAGTLDGWTATTTCGAGGWFSYAGPTTPISSLSFYAPPEGISAAVSDATTSPGTHILHQDVILAAGQSHSLEFTLSYTNRAATFSSPSTLDCGTNPNQQYRVDIMTVASAIDSLTPADILLSVFKTNPDDPLTFQSNLTVDLTSFAGQTVRVRFAEVDNQGLLNASVDNVRITSSPLVVCAFSINPSARNYSAAGGSGTVDVTATSGCAWGAISNDFWIMITGPTGGNENGAIGFVAGQNIGPARIGTITLAGRVFTVRQGANFADVDPNSVFYEFIGKLSAVGITIGCGQNELGQPLYCPTQQVTREQMAAFLIRAMGQFNPPVPAQQRFTDVLPASNFYAFIDQMAERGITVGCNPEGTLYCPIQLVTREQMSAFLIRAVGMPNPPFPAQQRFLDVFPASVFYPFVEQMALRAITVGCNPPTSNLYCPSDLVTREQMAAFLVRAFGL